MQKSIRYVVWVPILNKFHLFKLSEIFTILLRNISNLNLVKKSKKISFNEKFKKIQFTIESA